MTNEQPPTLSNALSMLGMFSGLVWGGSVGSSDPELGVLTGAFFGAIAGAVVGKIVGALASLAIKLAVAGAFVIAILYVLSNL